MHFVTARDLRNKTAQLWKKLAVENEMVVTVNGHPVALLTAISEQNFEQIIRSLRRARAQLAISELQQASLKQGTSHLSDKEIEKEIQISRRDRKR
jgi:antitoxin (DNA-binding transcriptional repressor) of toxin-antitoxin stability system